MYNPAKGKAKGPGLLEMATYFVAGLGALELYNSDIKIGKLMPEWPVASVQMARGSEIKLVISQPTQQDCAKQNAETTTTKNNVNHAISASIAPISTPNYSNKTPTKTPLAQPAKIKATKVSGKPAKSTKSAKPDIQNYAQTAVVKDVKSASKEDVTDSITFPEDKNGACQAYSKQNAPSQPPSNPTKQPSKYPLAQYKLSFFDGREWQYEKAINEYAKEYGLDPAFVLAVIGAESSFEKDAKSRCGARGLGQIMPKTGEKWGITSGDKLYDPKTNIEVMCKELAYLFKRFKGKYSVVYAYNAGEGRVDNFINNGKNLPAETVAYGERIIKDLYPRYSSVYGSSSNTAKIASKD